LNIQKIEGSVTDSFAKRLLLELGLAIVLDDPHFSRRALADHANVLLPVAGQIYPTRPRFDPNWLIPSSQQDQPIKGTSTNPAAIELLQIVIPNLGHGLELKVHERKPSLSSLLLSVDAHNIEFFLVFLQRVLSKQA
jgi:hypothetical protein